MLTGTSQSQTAAPLWTSSNTRASSCSPATASRSPPALPATTVDEAVAAADEIGYPCVVKAQVLIGGRGKAGGIKLAKDRDEADASTPTTILGMDIRGFTVHEVWVEARVATSPPSTTRRSSSTAARARSRS